MEFLDEDEGAGGVCVLEARMEVQSFRCEDVDEEG